MRGSTGQAINIDYTVGLGVFMLSVLSGVLLVTNAHVESSGLEAAQQKASLVQQELRQETFLEGRQAPLYVRTPAATGNIPVDREYIFPERTYPGSGSMDVPSHINISSNRVLTVVSGVNSTHRLSYFYSDTYNLSYSNQIQVGNWMNNSKISVKPGSPGLTSLRVGGHEVLNPDASLGGTDFSPAEHELHASALSGDLKLYNGSRELILENPGTVTFDMKNFTTLYWHPGKIYELTGTGTIKSGNSSGFTVATYQGNDYGITFLSDELEATVSKPDSSTVRATIEAPRLRIYLHDTGYQEGRDRIQMFANGTLSFGVEKRLEGASSDSIEQLEGLDTRQLRETLDLGSFDYNITYGQGETVERFMRTIAGQQDWNTGRFNLTSADRGDNSGDLGIGYLNGTANDNLLAFWRMDADSDPLPGSFDVKDYSGESMNGTTRNFEGGERGARGILSTGSFNFDGNDDYVEVEHGNRLDTRDALTLSFWSYNPAGVSGTDIWNGGGWGYNGYTAWHINPGEMRVEFQNTTTGEKTVVDTSVPTDRWFHFAVSWSTETDTITTYVNGEERQTGTFTGPLGEHPRPLVIGYNNDQNGNYFDGKLDEIRLYNSSLSRSKIRRLYFMGRDGTFNGGYTGGGIDNSKTVVWKSLQANVSVPGETYLEATFMAIGAAGGVQDRETFPLDEGMHNYSLSVESTEDARVSFSGTSSNATKSWRIDSYRVFYENRDAFLSRGSPIPLRDVVVSDRSSVMLGRFGNYSIIENRVAVWR